MATSLLSLPTEERILLYLSDFGNLDEAYEAPSDVTQKEIAEGVRVQRKHISRYLHNLIEDGLVEEKKCHVRDKKQRMKCYALSWAGTKRAKEIREFVGNKTVGVLTDGKRKDMLVSEIDGATSVHLTLSDIVGEAIDSKGNLDMEQLEQIEDRKRRVVDERMRRDEVYRRALAAAWRSGVLTSSEKHLIDSLKEHLGISDEAHDSMEEKIIKDIDPLRTEMLEIYGEIKHIVGEKPTSKEETILMLLKDRFNIE